MKHLMQYEGFTSSERLDKILDKITNFGLESLSNTEKEFLDSHSSDKQEEIHKKMNLLENDIVFTDDDDHFRFEFSELEEYDDGEIHILGTLYVPDLNFEDGNQIKGELEGRIVVFSDKENSPDFYKQIGQDLFYEVWDFVEGLEHEFDSFIDYVVSEIEKMDELN